jgi:pimeloyl-ACP methyl ester carboxylesterase
MLAGRYRGTRLAVPTRGLTGGDDPVVRQGFLSGHEAYAEDLTVHLVSGASHFIADERPEAVVDLALEFFAGRSE